MPTSVQYIDCHSIVTFFFYFIESWLYCKTLHAAFQRVETLLFTMTPINKIQLCTTV